MCNTDFSVDWPIQQIYSIHGNDLIGRNASIRCFPNLAMLSTRKAATRKHFQDENEMETMSEN